MSNDTTPADAGDESDALDAPDIADAADTRTGKRVSRRGLFRAGAATGLTAAGAYAAVLPGVRSDADAAPAPAAVIPISQVQQVQQMAGAPAGANTLAGYTFFNPLMVDVITAAAERIIPRDENGPGATDAGVVYFIDRQLSCEYGMVGKRYGAGPFTSGTSNQGDQSDLSMRDRYRIGIDGIQAYSQATFQKDFKELGPDQQDQILRDMEGGKATGFPGSGGQTFFTLLVNHVKAGFFADPIYGGNRDMVGWKMIGYPGAQIVYQDWISRYGEKFTGPFMSIADHQEALHQPAGGAATGMMGMTTAPAPSTGGAAATAAAVSSPAPIATGAAGTAAPAAMAGGTTVNVITKDYSFAFDKTDIPAGSGNVQLENQGDAAAQPVLHRAQHDEHDDPCGRENEFTVNLPPGMAPYICAIPGHADLGMKGNLNIVPAMGAMGAMGATVAPAPTPAAMNANPAPHATMAPATMAPAAMAGGTTVNLIEKDFSFAFDISTIPAGRVIFNIVNQGKAPHNIEFTTINKVSATSNARGKNAVHCGLATGRLPYICNIPGHAQLGMKGTLTVK